jgi:hypothetical protein
MESQSSRSLVRKAEPWVALALCAAMALAGAMEYLVHNQPAYAERFAPDWLPFAAAGLAAAGIMRWNGHPLWLRFQGVLRWSGLLVMVWAANGLPLDLLRLVPGLMPSGVDWPGMATRALALAAAVVLAHMALARPAAPASKRPAAWYGYAAFVVALPYPVIRTWWALGGTVGLMWPGAAGHGFTPWLACIPWLLAAALSLLLVPTWRWMPRRLLVTAGWFATAVVAMIGPAACFYLVTRLIAGDTDLEGIANWVPGLFYGSWFLWAIAAGAATRSYQLRSGTPLSPRARGRFSLSVMKRIMKAGGGNSTDGGDLNTLGKRSSRLVADADVSMPDRGIVAGGGQ